MQFVKGSALGSLGSGGERVEVEALGASKGDVRGAIVAKTLAGTGVLTRINSLRTGGGLAALQWGADLERRLNAYTDHAEPDLSSLLDYLQASDSGAASAAVWHLITDSEDGISRRLEGWDRLMDPDMTHFAIHSEALPGGQYACVAAMIRKVEAFSLSDLHRESGEYVRDCPLCKRTHSIEFEDPNSTVVIACPHCDREYDLIAFGSDGRYRRANAYLTGFSPPASYRPGPPDLPLMITIWKTVLEHCRYRSDRFTSVGEESGDGGEDEIWRYARETYRARYGDCEDTSILLADWLGSRGFDVRVAVGINRSVGAHAWCVVRIGEDQYLLETTSGNPDLERPPLVENYVAEYTPHQLFDRETIYFSVDRELGAQARDYWSEDNWIPIRYPTVDLEISGADTSGDLLPEVGLGWGKEGR